MGASYISSRIGDSMWVSQINAKSENMFSFMYNSKSGNMKKYTVYVPQIDEYRINIDVISKALNLGANLIVYDSWAEVTIAGAEFGKENHIGIYGWKVFTAIVNKGNAI